VLLIGVGEGGVGGVGVGDGLDDLNNVSKSASVNVIVVFWAVVVVVFPDASVIFPEASVLLLDLLPVNASLI
jgi:hypothetical protein